MVDLDLIPRSDGLFHGDSHGLVKRDLLRGDSSGLRA